VKRDGLATIPEIGRHFGISRGHLTPEDLLTSRRALARLLHIDAAAAPAA
jgi:hypothetical protein